MVQELRPLDALPEVLCLISSSHITGNSSSRNLMPSSDLFRYQAYMWCTDIHIYKTPLYINKLKEFSLYLLPFIQLFP